MKKIYHSLIWIAIFCISGLMGGLLTYIFVEQLVTLYTFFVGFLVVTSMLGVAQGVITLIWMTHAWENPEQQNDPQEPARLPLNSFTALVPAKHEDKVIGATLRAISAIDYPEELKEVVVVCRFNDWQTILAVQKAIRALPESNIKLAIYNDKPVNKPHALNFGLKFASKDVIVVFDAEDNPNDHVYRAVNSAMINQMADVVQSGVQLINYRSPWFAMLNVMEYYFWFKSALRLFAEIGVVPLGGNTVFFKKNWLEKVGGWDQNCLTEDADIGIRLSVAGAKFTVIYSEQIATLEETPHNVSGFIRQRTRWNQGFLQIFLKGDWLQLPKLSQRLLTAYLLLWPEIQALFFLYVPLSISLVMTMKVPVLVAIMANVPMYLLLLGILNLNIGFYEFTKHFGFRYSWMSPLVIVGTFIPFNFLLGISALRAMVRMWVKNSGWEKTHHLNLHRRTENLPLNLT